MKIPPIVSPQEWQAARETLLVKEKQLTRARDALAAERRRMPMMAVEKDYEFEGLDGTASLLDLFDGPRQLLPRRPGRSSRSSERARHHPRVRLPRAAAGHRALEDANGLGDPVVHD